MPNTDRSVSTLVSLDTAWGGTEVIIRSADELLAYHTDADAFAARHFGVTKDQYVAWVENHGMAMCAATTKAGKLCGNMIAGQHDAKDHACLHRLVYCAVHESRPK